MKIPKWFPVALFALALVFASVTVLLFHHRLSLREAERDHLALEVADLDQRRMQYEEAMELYQVLTPRYQQAEGKGWWRLQDRLAWMETVVPMGHAVGLVKMRYTLSPSRQMWREGDFGVRSVAVDLEMGLVHGKQLLDLSNALERLGPFSWESCKIERQPGPSRPGARNLGAICRLEWLAIATSQPDTAVGDLGLDDVDFM